MFDIIGKVVSDETKSFRTASWREIAICESTAENVIQDENCLNVIPVRFKGNKASLPPILVGAWVKVRFALVSQLYERAGQPRLWLEAQGIAMRVLSEAKPPKIRDKRGKVEVCEDELPY